MGKQKKSTYNHFILKETPEYFHNSPFELEIRESTIKNAGKGVFAKSFIPKNVCIDEYVGDVKKFNPMGGYYFEIREEYGIDARNYPRCYMGMLNDSRNIYNCEFKVEGDRVYVWSISDISIGDELFICYGDSYF